MIKYTAKKIFAQFILLVTLTLTVFLGLGIFTTSEIKAIPITEINEGPGQNIYKYRETLKDQHRNTWQAIAFKRVSPNGKMIVELRLVGFPGSVEIDRSKPLVLSDSLGKTLTADDASSLIFTDLSSPEPNVGEYDIKDLLPELHEEIPLKLTLPVINAEPINLIVPSSFVKEWKTLLLSEE